MIRWAERPFLGSCRCCSPPFSMLLLMDALSFTCTMMAVLSVSLEQAFRREVVHVITCGLSVDACSSVYICSN